MHSLKNVGYIYNIDYSKKSPIHNAYNIKYLKNGTIIE